MKMAKNEKQGKQSNRTPVKPWVEPVETRDPKPQNRDPIQQNRDPHPCVADRQRPVIVRVDVPKCPQCSHTVFRNGGNSKPNISTQEMLRYRQCASCGRSFYVAVPMTDQQIKEHQAG